MGFSEFAEASVVSSEMGLVSSTSNRRGVDTKNPVDHGTFRVDRDGASRIKEDKLAAAARGVLQLVSSEGEGDSGESVTEMTVMISEIDPQHTSELLPILQEHFPLNDGLDHLKRVRREQPSDHPRGFRLHVLLTYETEWEQREKHLSSLLSRFDLQPTPLKVPAKPTSSDAEHQHSQNVWPITVRPPRHPHVPPTDSQLCRMFKHLQSLYRISQLTLSSRSPHLSVVAILVHPESNIPVAAAIDTSTRSASTEDSLPYPVDKCLRHAVMNCVRVFAARRAQMADPGAAPSSKRPRAPAKSDQTESSTSSAADSRDMSSCIVDDSNVTDLLLQVGSNGRAYPLPDDQYLCTGLDCYVTREPCSMCAMALVHSRIRRVIFAEWNNSLPGGLSVARVHTERALNHRYEAYYLPTNIVLESLRKNCSS